MSLFRNSQSVPPNIDKSAIEKVIREVAGQQIPPGGVPADRIAGSLTDMDLMTTIDGKPQWASASSLLDGDYLRLDASNDPITGNLQFNLGTSLLNISSSGFYVTNNTADTGRVGPGYIELQEFAGSEFRIEATEDDIAQIASGDDLRRTDDGSHNNSLIRKSQLDAHVNDTTDAHASTAVSVTETGIIIPTATNLQQALSQVEAWSQNLEERFEQHHHDERYDGPSVRVTKNDQLIATATETYLVWENESWDSREMHDPSSSGNIYRQLTIVEPGVYDVKAVVGFDVNATGIRYAAFDITSQIPGTTSVYYFGVWPGSPAPYVTMVRISDLFRLQAGDTIRVRAFQGSGGNLNVLGAYSRFMATRVSTH